MMEKTNSAEIGGQDVILSEKAVKPTFSKVSDTKNID
jgi:hypothetical protein